jgi:hypothetical protein
MTSTSYKRLSALGTATALAQRYPLFTRGRFMRNGKDRVEVADVQVPVALGTFRSVPATSSSGMTMGSWSSRRVGWLRCPFRRPTRPAGGPDPRRRAVLAQSGRRRLGAGVKA